MEFLVAAWKVGFVASQDSKVLIAVLGGKKRAGFLGLLYRGAHSIIFVIFHSKSQVDGVHHH